MDNTTYSNCIFCGNSIKTELIANPHSRLYVCPICGRYEYLPQYCDFSHFNRNHLSSYLAYNGFNNLSKDYGFFSTRSKDACARLKESHEKGLFLYGFPVHLDPIDVENWFPYKIEEKVEWILKWLDWNTRYWGDSIRIENKKVYSAFFVEIYKHEEDQWIRRSDEELDTQLKYIINYLGEQELIESPLSCSGNRPITLAPKGYARLEKSKYTSTTQKSALVAMAFNEKTLKLREAIRKGIQDAGYLAVFIDEVEHNDFITPELLKHIEDSKFVVVDLSHQNNGAYFEEGYAMGIGKPVIQLCKQDVKLHFDIAQKNTIIWSNESEIPDRLKRRILATID